MWKVSAGAIEADGYNLDRRNPNRLEPLSHRAPVELLTELATAQREIVSLLEEIGVNL